MTRFPRSFLLRTTMTAKAFLILIFLSLFTTSHWQATYDVDEGRNCLLDMTCDNEYYPDCEKWSFLEGVCEWDLCKYALDNGSKQACGICDFKGGPAELVHAEQDNRSLLEILYGKAQTLFSSGEQHQQRVSSSINQQFCPCPTQHWMVSWMDLCM